MTSMSREYKERMGKRRAQRVRSGILTPEARQQAVKRITDEFNVRQKVSPEAQRKSAESVREARNKERVVNSHGGAVKAPKAGGRMLAHFPLSKLPRKHQTTRGLRRLSFRQAYSRRTTDSSRARVLKLYGRSKPPSPQIPKVGDQGSRRIHKPVATGSPEQQAARMRAQVQSKVNQFRTGRRRKTPSFTSRPRHSRY